MSKTETQLQPLLLFYTIVKTSSLVKPKPCPKHGQRVLGIIVSKAEAYTRLVLTAQNQKTKASLFCTIKWAEHNGNLASSLLHRFSR